MKKLLFAFLFISALTAHALPPQAEADKLMIEASAALRENNYATAVRNLTRVEELKARVPDAFPYHYGVALAGTGEFARAKQQLDRYVTQAGSNGKFYKEALEIYAKIEAKEVDTARKEQVRIEDEKNAIAAKNAEAARLNSARQAAYEKKLAQYKSDVESYDQRVKNEQERVQEASASCTTCSESCSKKHSGFFGNAVEGQKCYHWCSDMFCSKLNTRYIPTPTAPVKP